MAEPVEFRAVAFCDVPIGAEFRFDLGVESGLLHDLNRPGRVVYRRASARTWEMVAIGERARVGSIDVKVWVQV